MSYPCEGAFGIQGPLYKQVYADDNLTNAWRHVRTGTELAGVDGVTVAQFQSRLFANLKSLQEDLRRRRYMPQPVKRLSMPKSDGASRALGILAVRDRIVQRSVLLVIDPILDAKFEECSHGYRKGRSVQSAMSQVARLVNLGYSWVVDFDIASCFDSINTSRLYQMIKSHVRDDEIQRLISAWLDVETATVIRSGWLRQPKKRGILQGGILSPLFANTYLDRFDKAALRQGLKLVRFADDGIICCRSQGEAEAALKMVCKLLAKLDLTVNPRKTAIQHVDKGFEYLGEKLFLRHRGDHSETLVMQPVKKTESNADAKPVRQLLPAPQDRQNQEEDEVWERSI